jgi:hypothetical protein
VRPEDTLEQAEAVSSKIYDCICVKRLIKKKAKVKARG